LGDEFERVVGLDQSQEITAEFESLLPPL